MTGFDDIVDAVVSHSRAVIAIILVLTVLIGAGVPAVSQSSSLDQFRTDSPEAEKLDYIETNFSAGEENTTTAQVIVRDEDVLDRESLVGMLRYQQTLEGNRTVNDTLTSETPTTSVANAIAVTAIRRQQVAALERNVTRLRELNRTVTSERRAIQENRSEIQNRSRELNTTARDLRSALTFLRENPNADIRPAFEEVQANTSVELNETDYQIFREAARDLRAARSREEAEAAYEQGTRGVLADDYRGLEERTRELEARAQELEEDAERLRELADRVERQRATLRNASRPTLSEQIAALESMNESELNATIESVLSSDRGGETGVFQLMPTDYEPGATQAEATVILVTHRSSTASGAPGAASEPVVEAQLAMQTLSGDADGGEYIIFGAGVISDEIDASMTDSLLIVSPLALLFVFFALLIAYRDPLDILLGLVGIGLVLVWTFGFMGWADIAFNQIFVAVPVLLIGLSIDYAIHVFMRHREERLGTTDQVDTDSGSTPIQDASTPREAMRVALGGVGVALVWVTATTVIGFLSNLISPVAPIREFGVVSSVGILAAFLVFAAFTPAVKVELDGLLESWGFDRRKRAFGTGGGAFSGLLATGSIAARKAPYLVLILAVIVTGAGAYGGAQVDTSFEQSDFLAEDPPAWTDQLPEPFRPGEYSAKANLEYVNDNFVRQDSQAQILVEGNVTRTDTLERLDRAEEAAAEKGVTQTLSTGDADVRSPLSVMRTVAAENESFNETFTAADTDGDGIPDRNLEQVYDVLFRVAPDQAARVIHREDGEYRAVRLVISVRGGASGEAITSQMREVADSLDGNGLDATATGTAVLNKIVQDELLETVIESLLITVVAVFAFLMIAYRLANGSASLGAVTLLPVVLSVAWILGTMFLLDVPFNVLTGTITSLTVGLGVAYSIHLSERYTQELDRTGSVWTAMDRAVTGTGGALLGSAATTVGGFGVLIFAILPPLQQFGLITGLTIVYAFLAAVLVLPSLLVLWTRFLGPDWADTTAEGPSEAAAAPVEDDTAAFDDGGFIAATAEKAGVSAIRSTGFRHASPGDRLEVTVEIEDAADRVFLTERTPFSDPEMLDVEPEPVEAATRDERVYVAWEGPGEASVRYALEIPTDVDDGEELSFDGTVETATENVPVGGTTVVDVVENLFERLLAEGSVTDGDLRTARERLETGDLTDQQFERIYRAWLRDSTDTAGELMAGEEKEDGRDGI